MGQEEVVNKVVELERKVAILPEGNITKKKAEERPVEDEFDGPF